MLILQSAIYFLLVSCAEEKPLWPIQSPNNGIKEERKRLKGREIRSSLLILDLNEGKM